MKKLLNVSLLVVLVLVKVFAGGEEEISDFDITDDSELVIWADDTRYAILTDLGAQFTETYGVPVSIQEVGFGEIRDNIKIAAPAGEGPDIIIGAHDWLGELVNSGIVAPIDLGKKRDDFTSSSIAAFTYDGILYGMPYSVENVAFIYNKDLVSEVPGDWDAVRRVSEEIMASGVAKYGFIRQEGDAYHFFPMQTAYGGYVFGMNADGTYDPEDIGIDSEGSIQALEWLEAMIDDGVLPAGLDWDGYHVLFETGDAAMTITGPWALERLRTSGINYGIAPLPGGGKPFLGVQGFMISAFSENIPMATAFLTEFAATRDVMFEIFEKGGRPPAFKEVLGMVDDPDLAGFTDAGLDGLPMPAIPEMSVVWKSWGDAIILVMQDQISARDAFENAGKHVRETIKGN